MGEHKPIAIKRRAGRDTRTNTAAHQTKANPSQQDEATTQATEQSNAGAQVAAP